MSSKGIAQVCRAECRPRSLITQPYLGGGLFIVFDKLCIDFEMNPSEPKGLNEQNKPGAERPCVSSLSASR